jgi:mRNA interferase MazF
VKQYEIRWARLPEPIGRRPLLLLSRSEAFRYLSRVLVAEITTTVRGIPQEVPLGKEEGLQRASVANMDNVHTVPKAYLKGLIGTLGAGREREVKRALGYTLGWAELKTL